LEHLDVEGREDNFRINTCRIIRCGLDASGSGQGPVAHSRDYGNELSGSIKEEEFLDQQSNCKFLTEDSASCY
jgi:hypothetical protein